MTTPYEMFKAKEIKTVNTPIKLDYVSFQIFVKFGGATNRSFIDAFNLKMRPFERRAKLAAEGRLDVLARELLDKQRQIAMAELYADHVIIGWENIKDEKGKKMEFSRENVIKLLTDLDALFADIIEQAANEANFAEEERVAEEKN
jgi:hypothetical protein